MINGMSVEILEEKNKYTWPETKATDGKLQQRSK